MVRGRYTKPRRSYAIDSESPHSNKDSDTVPVTTRNWRRTRLRRRNPRYQLSHTEDDEEEHRIFTPRERRSLRTSALVKTRSAPSRASKRHYDTSEDISMNKSSSFIRRSTRQRKSRYDTYNDSWIVGSQVVKGYPRLSRSSMQSGRMSRKRMMDLQQDEEDDAVEEADEDDGEEGDDDFNEEEDQDDPEETKPDLRSLRSTRLHKRISSLASSGKASTTQEKNQDIDKNGEEVESDSTSEQDSGPKATQESYQDMYARVKQRRRVKRLTDVNEHGHANEGGDEEEDDSPRTRSRRRPVSPPKSDNAEKRDTDSSSEESCGGRVLRTRNMASRQTYHLRQVKPTVTKFQASGSLKRRRRRWADSSTSSSSSSDSGSRGQRGYDRNKKKGKSSKRALCGASGKGSKGKLNTTGLLADVDPVALDTSIRFSHVGGLESHINCLKEMVVFPMLYKDIFEKFNVTPPKGVLFHGPPGTGKTLMARALANECSQGSRKVSFFMRKGADCLSKWVGESERQLRILFDEAKQARPSIIFFDELDGLAPVRSSKQDQIHASIVCTLLALMDGLDSRGDIIVIGSTNRIDSIDPALRRPGRFDRELYFPLPGVKERREILSIHTEGWGDEAIISKMAEESWGYCGSDLKALCSEAVIQSLRRVYPQIYQSSQKLKLDPGKVKVQIEDFMRAKRSIVPASKRSASCLARRLPAYLEPLLRRQLDVCLDYISSVFPQSDSHREKLKRNPRLALIGENEAVMNISWAILHRLEHCSVLSISLETLFEDSAVTPEESISRVMREARQRSSPIIWMGDVNLWWSSLSPLTRSVFLSLILGPPVPILFLATASGALDEEISHIFSPVHGEVKELEEPKISEIINFFSPLIKSKTRQPPLVHKSSDQLEPLEVAPPTPPRPMSEAEVNQLYYEEEMTLRELRIFLRQICSKLARNKQFYMFSKPVDINEVPDYLNIIHEPMDLETMMTKIDLHRYTCAEDFLKDIDLLCRNALEYNPDKDPEDKLIRHRACYLRDTAYALIKAEMDSDFEISCQKIRDKRSERGAESGTARFVREFFPDSQPNKDEPPSPVPPSTTSNTLMNRFSDVVVNGLDNDAQHNADSEPEPILSKKKKKRRSSSYARGILPKRRRTTATTHFHVSSKSDDDKGDPEDDEPLDHSSPIKRVDEPLVNGVSSSEPSGDGLDDSIALTEASIPSNAGGDAKRSSSNNCVLQVDEEGLHTFFDQVIAHAKTISSYSTLIDLYVSLSKIVYSYSHKWDRLNMVKDLTNALNFFISSTRMNSNQSASSELSVPDNFFT